MTSDDVSRTTVQPLLRVLRGSPDAAELAALTTVMVSLPRAVRPPRRVVSAWTSPQRALARQPFGRRGGWRASALPR